MQGDYSRLVFLGTKVSGNFVGAKVLCICSEGIIRGLVIQGGNVNESLALFYSLLFFLFLCWLFLGKVEKASKKLRRRIAFKECKGRIFK